MPVEFWEKRRLTQEIGTEVYEAAFFDPNGGHIHPMKLVHVFKTAAQAARAEVYENTTVAHIEEGRNISCIQPADTPSGQNRWCWRPMRSLQDWDSSGTRSCPSMNT